MDEILSQLKQAQLDRDEIKVSTLRLLLSEIKNTEIQKQQPLTEQEIIAVVQKGIKQRKEASEGFKQGGREDAAEKEEAELKILETFLPSQLSNEELTKLVEEAITETGAKNIQDMGRVIGLVMGKVAGKADGARVSTLVKEKLTV